MGRVGKVSWAALWLVAAAAASAGCADDDEDAEAARSSADAGGKRTSRSRARGAVDGGDRRQLAADAGSDAGGATPTHPKPDAAAAPALDEDDAGCAGASCGQHGPDGPCVSRALGEPIALASEPAHVLLIQDRSGSMAEAWNGTPRWQAAGAAVEQAFAALSPAASAGALFFPSSDPDAPLQCVDATGIACMFVPLYVQGGTCGVGVSSDPDQLDFMAAPDFLVAFAQEPMPSLPRYAPVPGSFTPLKEALQEAKTRLTNAPFQGKTAVIILSDGDANCDWDAAVAHQIVSDWQAAGIDTYAVALPTPSMASEVLTEVASVGGTVVRKPADAAGLASELEQIVNELQGGASSCVLSVPEPPPASKALQLIVTFSDAPSGMRYLVPSDLGGGAGWQANADRSEVELLGGLCDAVRANRFASLAFEAGCVDLPDLPPL